VDWQTKFKYFGFRLTSPPLPIIYQTSTLTTYLLSIPWDWQFYYFFLTNLTLIWIKKYLPLELVWCLYDVKCFVKLFTMVAFL
jgi:hypothetical protein